MLRRVSGPPAVPDHWRRHVLGLAGAKTGDGYRPPAPPPLARPLDPLRSFERRSYTSFRLTEIANRATLFRRGARASANADSQYKRHFSFSESHPQRDVR
jgi:hypothetical protein